MDNIELRLNSAKIFLDSLNRYYEEEVQAAISEGRNPEEDEKIRLRKENIKRVEVMIADLENYLVNGNQSENHMKK